jgi:hypothetical protein
MVAVELDDGSGVSAYSSLEMGRGVV